MKDKKPVSMGGKGNKQGHAGMGKKQSGFGSKLGKVGHGSKMIEGPSK